MPPGLNARPCNQHTSNRARQAIFDGTKRGTRVPGCEFNGVKTFAEWKPPNGREGLGKILKEGLDRSCNAVKDVIKMTLAFHPVARLVMRELLAANKIVIMALLPRSPRTTTSL
jgi:hypothetical protein